MNSQELQNSILDCLQNYTQDETELINQLDQSLKKEGMQAYSIFFQILTHINFPPEKAKEHWIQLIEHYANLKKILNRNVNLRTAACDYFCSIDGSLVNPKLIEINVYDEEIKTSRIDFLTGLYSRSYFDKTFKIELKRAQRHKSDISIIFFDLDDFKQVNDTYGHLVGDYVLKKVAEIILANQREEDTTARYGGEEFVMIMPHTNSIQAIIFAERVRQKVEASVFTVDNHNVTITISGGISTFPKNGDKIKSLLKAADSALYSAKNSGKNEIVVYTKENRKYLRIDFLEDVDIERSNSHKIFDRNLQSKNLSKNGILFENNHSLDIGTRLKIKIPIDETSEPLVIDGIVARVELYENGKYDIGVSFIDMGKNLKSGIAQAIIRQLQNDASL
jgi:diguanylate cyclase (GGDEF)-like protein